MMMMMEARRRRSGRKKQINEAGRLLELKRADAKTQTTPVPDFVITNFDKKNFLSLEERAS